MVPYYRLLKVVTILRIKKYYTACFYIETQMIVSIFVSFRRILFYVIKTKGFFSVTKNKYYTVIKKKNVDTFKLFTFFLNLEQNVTKIFQ